jgi:hypothetical protein
MVPTEKITEPPGPRSLVGHWKSYVILRKQVIMQVYADGIVLLYEYYPIQSTVTYPHVKDQSIERCSEPQMVHRNNYIKSIITV